MRIFFMFFVFIFGSQSAIAQLTIEECYLLSTENYPLLKQYDLFAKTKDFNVSNAAKGYLPQLSFSGKASYQSDVTKIPLNIPGVSTQKKDQYGVQVNVDQSIWDGGIIRSQQKLSGLDEDVNIKKLDVDLYTIRERVNQLYFSLLLLKSQHAQLMLFEEELANNYRKVESYIENGLANQADLDVVKIEVLKTRQNISTTLLTLKSYAEVLSLFIGKEVSENAEFEVPTNIILSNDLQILSPELSLFSAQQNRLEAQKGMLKASYMPKLGLFLQAGYGRPSLNMLETKFDPFYVGGVKFQWNISSLYTKSNDTRLIDLNSEMIDSNRETFLFNKRMEMTQDQISIEKQKKLLEQDDEIIRLRMNVKRASEAKLENGIITVTDLMDDVIAEELAKQDRILHEIELLQAIYKLKYTTNN